MPYTPDESKAKAGVEWAAGLLHMLQRETSPTDFLAEHIVKEELPNYKCNPVRGYVPITEVAHGPLDFIPHRLSDEAGKEKCDRD